MKRIVLGLTLLAAVSGSGAWASSKSSAAGKVQGVKYRAHCGMTYTAAQAKKYHYVCPMDHLPLVKIAPPALHGRASGHAKPSLH